MVWLNFYKFTSRHHQPQYAYCSLQSAHDICSILNLKIKNIDDQYCFEDIDPEVFIVDNNIDVEDNDQCNNSLLVNEAFYMSEYKKEQERLHNHIVERISKMF